MGNFEVKQEIKDIIKPGRKVRLLKPWKPKLIHILAIVDDEQVVYKFWSRRSWHYAIEWIYIFQIDYESGKLTKV